MGSGTQDGWSICSGRNPRETNEGRAGLESALSVSGSSLQGDCTPSAKSTGLGVSYLSLIPTGPQSRAAGRSQFDMGDILIELSQNRKLSLKKPTKLLLKDLSNPYFLSDPPLSPLIPHPTLTPFLISTVL